MGPDNKADIIFPIIGNFLILCEYNQVKNIYPPKKSKTRIDMINERNKTNPFKIKYK